jgi:hypothetical protein
MLHENRREKLSKCCSAVCGQAANSTRVAPGVGGGITAGISSAKNTPHKTVSKAQTAL